MMRIAKGMPVFCNGFKTNSCVGCAAFGCGVHSHIGENAAIKIIGCRLKRPSPPGKIASRLTVTNRKGRQRENKKERSEGPLITVVASKLAALALTVMISFFVFFSAVSG